MKHCMVDIETMGVLPTSAILSIGAVIFDPYGNKPSIEQFYVNVDPQTCLDLGLTKCESTMAWWKTQPKHIRDALKTNRIGLNDALTSFMAFYNKHGCERVWGHGSIFDITILSNAFKAVGIKYTPWKFSQVMDTRTIFDQTGVVLDYSKEHHNALHDAQRQANAVCEAIQLIKTWRSAYDVINDPANVYEDLLSPNIEDEV